MGVIQFNTGVSDFILDGITINRGTMDFNGTAAAIKLDADGDTTIYATTDDQIDFNTGGSNRYRMDNSGLTLVSAAVYMGGQGSTRVPLMPIAAQQDLSGAGAITITEYYTAWTTTGANAGTLADGAQIGQVKKITMIVDAGDGTLTPSNLDGGTTITFADVGDTAELMFDGTNWVAIALYNIVDGATAPVLA